MVSPSMIRSSFCCGIMHCRIFPVRAISRLVTRWTANLRVGDVMMLYLSGLSVFSRGGEQVERDPKRHAWVLASMVPLLLPYSWVLVAVTGWDVLWWSIPIVIFVVAPFLELLAGDDAGNLPDSVLEQLQNDLFYRWVTYLYVPTQYLALFFACWCWSGGGWQIMDMTDKLGLMAASGTLGGMAINAAHELGHRRPKVEVWLSKIALAQTCYGHFFVEHNRGHHSRVATELDPASAQMGENVYTFALSSAFNGFISAWKLETKRLHLRRRSTWSLSNNILNAWLISVGLVATLVVWFGAVVLPWLAGQALLGAFLLEVVNYLEHYGLRRQKHPNGRYEQVRPVHSWNSASAISNILLFNLQRHSDHHANPQRRYQTLRHTQERLSCLWVIPVWLC